MKAPALLANESERLKMLKSYQVLDTLEEADYDNITSIASQICDTPIALISLVDEDRQWFKSHHGLNAQETPREYAFCAHAIHTPELIFTVNDARQDERFYDNPLVINDPEVVFYSGVPLTTSEGHSLGTLCVIDHSPRQLSDDQEKALGSLSRQVMRLLELRKNRIELEEANNNLQRRNRELDRFASIAAHDLKAPVNNIASLAQLIETTCGDNLGSEGYELVGYIKKSADKSKELIDGLLTFSRVDLKVKNGASAVKPVEVVQDLRATFSAEKKCQIRLFSELTSMEINPIAFDQILTNLVSNAIKYNDKEVVEVQISIYDKDSHYKCSVSDNGPGIPQEMREKVFELFFHGAKSDRYGNTGTGIGLATVHKTIHALGGDISISDADKGGACITFTMAKSTD